jgi:molecular chaperone GrpE
MANSSDEKNTQKKENNHIDGEIYETDAELDADDNADLRDGKDADVSDMTLDSSDDAGLDDSVVSEEAAGDTIKKLRLNLKKALTDKQEYLTGWQKDKAEFVNARKRDQEAQKDFIKFSNENLLAELIPVLDSFSMAFGNKEAWEKVDKNWRVGVEYIANQLKKVLEEHGVTELDPTGQKFDPMRDEAVEYVPVTDAAQDHVVTSVIQKGYSLNGKIIKAPRVKVGEFKKA